MPEGRVGDVPQSILKPFTDLSRLLCFQIRIPGHRFPPESVRILTQFLRWHGSEIECNTHGQLSASANVYISTSLGAEWCFSCEMSIGTFLTCTLFFSDGIWDGFSCLVWKVCLWTHLLCVALCLFYCLWRRKCSIHFFLFPIFYPCWAIFFCQ